MRKERVNCILAGCNNCAKGVRVGESLFGDDLYRCSAYRNKHKKIDARDCGAFRCNTPNDGILCKDCRKGKWTTKDTF